MSESASHEVELQKQIERLQRQLEELRDKYDASQQKVKFMGLEKKEIHQELERVKQENDELRQTNIELNSIKDTMEIEREHLFQPTMKELEATHDAKTQLTSELTIKSEHIEKLNNENIQIKQENEKYKENFFKYDTKVRKKEEKSNTLLKTLDDQIETLKHENEELNKKLFKCELDLYSIQKQTFIQSDDEKVLLNHTQSDIEIEIIDNDDEMDNINTLENNTLEIIDNDNDNIYNTDSDTPVAELKLNSPVARTTYTSRISGRKTSICLSFDDLATVLERTDSNYSLKSKLMQLRNNSLVEIEEGGLNNQYDGFHFNQDVDGKEDENNDNNDNDEEDERLNKYYDDNLKDDKIKELNEENEKLRLEVETYLNKQKELENKLDKKEKKINNLKQRNESLQMTVSKKSCNLVPWCR